MVDALKRATRWTSPPDGCLVDLRPADVEARVEIRMPDGSTADIGPLIVDPERRWRHAAADAAVRAVTRERLVRVDREEEFPFFRYAESPDELRDYIATKWQQTRLDERTHAAATAVLSSHPGARLVLREQVAVRVLTPVRP